MGCHFHIMRRRKAALKASQAVQEAKKDEVNTNPAEATKTAQAAPEGTKRASKKKGDAK